MKKETVVKIKYTCKCGYSNHALVERRRYFRKHARISGDFINLDQKVKGDMDVIDISRSGIKIAVPQNNESSSFKIGESLKVKFYLNGSVNSLVKKRIVIRSVSGCQIGAQFTDRTHEYEINAFMFY